MKSAGKRRLGHNANNNAFGNGMLGHAYIHGLLAVHSDSPASSAIVDHLHSCLDRVQAMLAGGDPIDFGQNPSVLHDLANILLFVGPLELEFISDAEYDRNYRHRSNVIKSVGFRRLCRRLEFYFAAFLTLGADPNAKNEAQDSILSVLIRITCHDVPNSFTTIANGMLYQLLRFSDRGLDLYQPAASNDLAFKIIYKHDLTPNQLYEIGPWTAPFIPAHLVHQPAPSYCQPILFLIEKACQVAHNFKEAVDQHLQTNLPTLPVELCEIITQFIAPTDDAYAQSTPPPPIDMGD